MTRLVEQELQTSRYCGGPTADGGCVCCGIDYAGGGPLCLRCQAPLVISRTVRQRGAPPRFIPVLGPSGAGKTVYLGMLLDILSKGTRRISGLATGAFSVGLQEQTTTALQDRGFPAKTSVEAEGWQWVHCEVSCRNRPKGFVDIITPDFAGESIAREIDQPGSFPAIRNIMLQSCGLLILCDSGRVRDAGLGEDLFALKLASYLVHLHGAAKKSPRCRKLDTPVAFVLTKSDVCDDAREAPERFARNNLPRLVQFCDSKFARFRFFASSVVGSSATLVDVYGCRTQIPFHVEPRGVTEPLEWVTGLG